MDRLGGRHSCRRFGIATSLIARLFAAENATASAYVGAHS
ncbi:hypothetical protein I552_0954 [Mycobacterium xenopi 3993]|nr:hypothetical protein I552_0954 [Mycobacterium xenopi 3993]